jgi:signal transduction histidine kinase
MFCNNLGCFIKENLAVIMLLLNFFIMLGLAFAFVFIYNSKRHMTKVNQFLDYVTKVINSIRYGDLTKKIEMGQFEGSAQLTESINKMIDALHDRESMIEEYRMELRKQNNLLRSVINSLSEGLIIIDEDEKMLRVTSAAQKWFLETEENLLGRKLNEYVQIPQKCPIQLLNNSEVIVPTEKSSNFIASTVKLKSEIRDDCYIVILKNITDQKELETLKEDFVATLTHDLKVPIIAEKNMIELFLNKSFGEISEKQTYALKNMQSSNAELLDLVQIVLDTYKAGKIKLYKEDVMLKSFLDEIIAEMTPIANKSKNKIELIYDRDIRVFADRFKLKRVVKNLIQNAILYGEVKSPIEISIGEIPKYVVIKVKDYGAGISSEDVDRIFNKYYSAAKKFRKIGTGLGLYLASQIMKSHNGDLSVESVKGEYTEFCVKIPV